MSLLAPPNLRSTLSLCTHAHRRVSLTRLSRAGNRLNPGFVADRAQAIGCREVSGVAVPFCLLLTRSSQRNYAVVVLPHRSRLIVPPTCVEFPARSSSVPARRHRRRTMNSLFHAEESSFRTAKRIAVVVAGLVILGLAMWAGMEMALRVASGR